MSTITENERGETFACHFLFFKALVGNQSDCIDIRDKGLLAAYVAISDQIVSVAACAPSLDVFLSMFI